MGIKKLMEAFKIILKNPNLFSELIDEKNAQRKEVKDLRNENDDLNEEIETLRNESNYLNKIREETMTQISQIAGQIEYMLDFVISDNSKLDAKEIYERLEFIDPEGWCIYRASETILNIDVYNEFIVEDTMGRFEESNGYELKDYMEIAAFGDCTFKIISGIREIFDTYAIDYDSKEYNDYLNELYPLSIHKLVDKLYKEEPLVKLQFIQQQMTYSSQEMKEVNGDKRWKLESEIGEDASVENESKGVDDEEMEM